MWYKSTQTELLRTHSCISSTWDTKNLMVRTTDVTPCMHCYQNCLQSIMFAKPAARGWKQQISSTFSNSSKINHPWGLSIECTRQMLQQIMYKGSNPSSSFHFSERLGHGETFRWRPATRIRSWPDAHSTSQLVLWKGRSSWRRLTLHSW